jgi:hypothetical protein
MSGSLVSASKATYFGVSASLFRALKDSSCYCIFNQLLVTFPAMPLIQPLRGEGGKIVLSARTLAQSGSSCRQNASACVFIAPRGS